MCTHTAGAITPQLHRTVFFLAYHPVPPTLTSPQAIAIDPRFATRKTKEFVAVNEAGVVQLSTQVRPLLEFLAFNEAGVVLIRTLITHRNAVKDSWAQVALSFSLSPTHTHARTCTHALTQGWLGRSDYALGGHMAPGVGTVVGKAQVVRWWKDLVAWASDSALVAQVVRWWKDLEAWAPDSALVGSMWGGMWVPLENKLCSAPNIEADRQQMADGGLSINVRKRVLPS
eukprot:scaffold33023_cov22-Tisochrysis_lutea.AAC.2